MALETGNYISDLDAANPTGTDVKSQGDDHIRLVKKAVKQTFPSVTGAVTATHTEMSLLSGMTSLAPATSGSAILKGNGSGGFSAASSGTDYAPATSGSAILKGSGSGGFSNASAGTDYQAPIGTISGIAKGNGANALTAATANSDYLVPALANTAVTGFKTATFNSQATLSTTTGAVTIDWTAAQNYKQNEPTGTITYTFTDPPGPCHLQLLIDSDGTSTAQTINWPGNVTWYGVAFVGTNNKKSIVNLWFDGTNYHGAYLTQV